jgi:acetoacetyl-CoA synthetase
VRIGTAEIYKPLEHIPEVIEGLAVGKREDGDEVIWLFVVLQEAVVLDESLSQRIRATIRKNSSPRHQPKRVFQVSQLPRTRSGKATEIAVSRLVNDLEVPNREVMANPEALDEIAAVIKAAS